MQTEADLRSRVFFAGTSACLASAVCLEAARWDWKSKIKVQIIFHVNYDIY